MFQKYFQGSYSVAKIFFLIFITINYGVIMASEVNKREINDCIQHHSSKGVQEVSLIQLIATPSSYEDQYVRVKGVFQYGVSDLGAGHLFIDVGSEKNYIFQNSVALSIDDNILKLFPDLHQISGTYQLIEGVFKAKQGLITPICRISEIYVAYGDALNKLYGKDKK